MDAGFIEIVTYKEKPKTILVYDADEVIAYLKSHELFVEEDEYIAKGELNSKSSAMYQSYTNWYRGKRDK